MGKYRVFLLGRHAPEGLDDLGFDIVEQRAVTYPADYEKAVAMLADIVREAAEKGLDGVLMQNTPSQIGAAFLAEIFALSARRIKKAYVPIFWAMSEAEVDYGRPDFFIGTVTSVPGERPAGVVRVERFSTGVDAESAAGAIRLANPRAKVQVEGNTVKITVDPPMRFQLSHVTMVTREGVMVIRAPHR